MLLSAPNQCIFHRQSRAGEVKGLKAQCNSLADAAQAEKFELLAAKQENDRLNDQIVQVCKLHAVWAACDLAHLQMVRGRGICLGRAPWCQLHRLLMLACS
jgi:hypothetical protein